MFVRVGGEVGSTAGGVSVVSVSGVGYGGRSGRWSWE
jgi:hypothetical protein